MNSGQVREDSGELRLDLEGFPDLGMKAEKNRPRGFPFVSGA